MYQNTYGKASTLSVIAISAILLTSFAMIGIEHSYRAMAQNSTSAPPSGNATSPSGNATGAAPSGTATGAAPSANATSTQEPAAGQSFVWQGTKSSQSDPLATLGKGQVAAILLPRSDSGVYSGVVTYTASKPVNVEVWHAFSPGNTSAIPTKTFGTLKTSDYQGKGYAVSDMSATGASGSVPFSGNVLLLHASSPFTVTYTVNAVAQPAKIVNNLESAMALATPTSPSKQTLTGGSVGGSSSGGSSSGGSSSGGSSSGGSSSGGSSSGSSHSKHSSSSSSSSSSTPPAPLA